MAVSDGKDKCSLVVVPSSLCPAGQSPAALQGAASCIIRLCVPVASTKEGILEMEVTEFLILVNCNVALHFFFKLALFVKYHMQF